MNKNDIDNLLDGLNESPVPKPNPEARKQAISEATEIFRQGLNESTRPIDEPAQKTAEKPNSIWSKIMNFLSNPNENRTGYHAFGTVAAVVAVVSVALVSLALFKPRAPLEEAIVINEDGSSIGLTESTPARTESTNQALNENKPATIVKTPKAKVKQETLSSPNSQLVDPQPQFATNSDNDAVVSDDAALTNPSKESAWGVDSSASNTGYSIDNLQTLNSEKSIASPAVDVSVDKQSFPVGSESLNQSVLAEVAVSSSATSTKKLQTLERKRRSPKKIALHQDKFATADVITPAPIQTDREEFANYETSNIQFVNDNPVSTFSADVDTASYSLIRNQLNNGYLPKPQAVRIEELINYFDYNYPLPDKISQPFSSNISVMDSPWNAEKKLVHIGIKGYEIASEKQPDSNLVFLLDVSGSMGQANKLPLVKQSLNLLLDTLKPSDTISIVVYAGAAGAVLEPTKVKEKTKILTALRNLQAGGSTAGGAGIRLAYQLAEQHFHKDAVNRIIIATDGDFNVGQQSNEDLKTLVERKRDSGIFLSVLGFGRGNYQDDMMQSLAQNGNGVAAYIDTLSEAKKVLVDEASSTLFTIAKDVKLQVEFNPATVSDYRLVGYETRALKKEDFNNDKVDAGDIGAGHTVTAIYEITPRDASKQSVDASRYSTNQKTLTQTTDATEYGFLKIRYKLPDQSTSRLIETPINTSTSAGSTDANFSIAVAGFGQLLTNSKHTGDLSYDDIIQSAQSSTGKDLFGYRSEFIQLVRMAKIANP